MKKLIFLVAALLLVVSCKKLDKTPEGPTDIRIRNVSLVTMSELTVETGGGTFNFGTLKKDSLTVYHRYDKAYVQANITAMVNGIKYKTDTAIYTYLQYLGPDKVTYELNFSSALSKLILQNVIHEEPIK